jgi:hypothetical protein
VQPGHGETFEALRDRMETLLGSARSCRFAEHRCLAADTVLDHETLQARPAARADGRDMQTSHRKRPRDRAELRAARRWRAFAGYLTGRLA